MISNSRDRDPTLFGKNPMGFKIPGLGSFFVGLGIPSKKPPLQWRNFFAPLFCTNPFLHRLPRKNIKRPPHGFQKNTWQKFWLFFYLGHSSAKKRNICLHLFCIFTFTMFLISKPYICITVHIYNLICNQWLIMTLFFAPRPVFCINPFLHDVRHFLVQKGPSIVFSKTFCKVLSLSPLVAAKPNWRQICDRAYYFLNCERRCDLTDVSAYIY